MKLRNKVFIPSLVVYIAMSAATGLLNYYMIKNSIAGSLPPGIGSALFDGIRNRTIMMLFIGMPVFALLFLLTIDRGIVKPIRFLSAAAADLSAGDFNIHVPAGKNDEIGVLTDNFNKLIQTINNLTDELEYVAVAQSEGVSTTLIDKDAYNGRYNEIGCLVNKMITEQNEITGAALNCVFEIGNGDFSASVRQFPGDKAALNKTVEILRKNLFKVFEEMSRLVNDAANGNLSSRAGSSLFNGDWSNLMAELNALLEAVTIPINGTISVLDKISLGDFSVKMTGDYKGDYLKIKTCVNKTVSDIGGYISEISSVLSRLSSGDFTARIDSEYTGEFQHLKNSINRITVNLNEVMSGLKSSAGQITLGSKQISDSSQVLASGSITQSGAVNNLNGITSEFTSIIDENSENADTANALSGEVKRAAALSNEEMGELLSAMDDIQSSFDSISSILKEIEAIAFQTNLLALNAAVEATRAGVYGRGFGVVADEVRALADRSQRAVQESRQFIAASTEKVKTGLNAAYTTSETLKKITGLIVSVSDSVSHIAGLSKKQTEKMDEVSRSVSDISGVTTANSSMSQEFAATAQELSSQADMFYSALGKFKLTEEKPHA